MPALKLVLAPIFEGVGKKRGIGMKKRVFLLALVFLMAAGLWGCGRKKEDGATAKTVSKDYVYRMKDLEIVAARQITRVGEDIYAYGTDWQDEGDSILYFYKLNNDGTIAETFSFPQKENVNLRNINLDDEGNIYCIENVFYMVGGESSSEGGDAPALEEEAIEPGEAQEEEGQDEQTSENEPASNENPQEDTQGEADAQAESEEDEATEDTQDADEAVQDMAVDAVDDVPTGDEEYVDDYYLTKMTLTGEKIFSVKLNDLPALSKLWEENGYFYISDMIFKKGNGIYLNSYGIFLKFDLEGNYVGASAKNENQELLDRSSFISLGDGRTVAIFNDEENGMTIGVVDLDTGTFGEKYQVPGLSYEFSFYAGTGYDLYMTDNYGVYGYNLGDADKTCLMNYIDSDLDFYNLYQVMGINETEFYAMHDDSETGDSVLAKFTKVPPEEVKEKQVINLAMGFTNWNIRRSVIQFNKESEDYRISISDYNSMYGSDDYMEGVNRLNTDIATGKVPDIIVLEDVMPVDSYISKGLLEDIKPYIERDAELDINNFMPNVVEAFSVNGKLYTVVPSYSIQTVLAKTSEVGEERGWTVQEALELLASKPANTMLFEMNTRDTILRYCLTMSGDQFIDWESGACNFDSDSFIQTLELISLFPEEVDDTFYEDEYWNKWESMWREGKVIASVNGFGDFRSYIREEKGRFGEKVTMIGFPCANEDGSVIWPDLQLAMSAKSKNKEGAWAFLRTFLTDEYQEENINYGFPISVKRLDELGEEATQKPYYMEDGKKVEYDDTYYIDGQEVIIPPMTPQEVEDFKEQLYSLTQVYKLDENLLKIIEEEAAPYFAGQKKAQDVAAIIQSRAQLYVNETR